MPPPKVKPPPSVTPPMNAAPSVWPGARCCAVAVLGPTAVSKDAKPAANLFRSHTMHAPTKTKPGETQSSTVSVTQENALSVDSLLDIIGRFTELRGFGGSSGRRQSLVAGLGTRRSGRTRRAGAADLSRASAPSGSLPSSRASGSHPAADGAGP